ncbi:hypothetical protein FNU76_01135 [Chitinimonas arctica]|uniref:Flagellar hook-length control protein FliK n=1 Tax=Chitinimonas arctica TaxID=2594795 RepID=A0A516SA89_9NEIS|nr:hypothetical protein [Chitinimonas arctica]QDQ25064.1 hypothetical protein FNU76_01135 [Chitinimonas arctica]
MSTFPLEGTKPLRAGRTSGRQEPDEESKRRFKKLLDLQDAVTAPPSGQASPWQAMSTPLSLETEQRLRGAPQASKQSQPAQMPLLTASSTLDGAGSVLHLRLLSGPLPGIELHVSLVAGALTLKLSTSDKRHHDKLTGKLASLEASLQDLFDYPLSLKVLHEPC